MVKILLSSFNFQLKSCFIFCIGTVYMLNNIIIEEFYMFGAEEKGKSFK